MQLGSNRLTWMQLPTQPGPLIDNQEQIKLDLLPSDATIDEPKEVIIPQIDLNVTVTNAQLVALRGLNFSFPNNNNVTTANSSLNSSSAALFSTTSNNNTVAAANILFNNPASALNNPAPTSPFYANATEQRGDVETSSLPDVPVEAVTGLYLSNDTDGVFDGEDLKLVWPSWLQSQYGKHVTQSSLQAFFSASGIDSLDTNLTAEQLGNIGIALVTPQGVAISPSNYGVVSINFGSNQVIKQTVNANGELVQTTKTLSSAVFEQPVA